MTTDVEDGDERILAMLWRGERPSEPGSPPALGRKPKLSLAEVVAGAVALADASGLDALSMSRLADALGVGTMTLYSYVSSKAELTALMVDHVLAARGLPGPGAPRPLGWRAQAELYAEHTRAMFGAHPWLPAGATIRPPLGPGITAGKEYLLSTLAGIGLTARQMNAAANSVAFFVDAAASFELAGDQRGNAAGDGVMADDQGSGGASWWEESFDAERYPTMVAVWHDGGFDVPGDLATFSFGFGFARLLDGIHAVTDRRGWTVRPGARASVS